MERSKNILGVRVRPVLDEKGPKRRRFGPFSVLALKDPGASTQRYRSHQRSHVGFDSRMASSWYQLSLHSASFSGGIFGSMEDLVSPQRRSPQAARPPIGNWQILADS
jgi:hypothetical protein